MKRNANTLAAALVAALVTVGSLAAQTEPVGIVMSAKPGVIVKQQGIADLGAAPGTLLYKNSVLALAAGSKAGMVQIYMAAEGLVTFTRFPVTFTAASVKPLPRDQTDRILAGIGGQPLTSGTRGTKGGEKVLDWFIRVPTEDYGVPKNYGNLGGLVAADIDRGLAIVFGADAPSNETYALDPLRYRFEKDVAPKAVKAELLDAAMEPRSTKAVELEKRDGAWRFEFRSFAYEAGEPYIVRFTFVLEDGSERSWGTGFVVRTADDVAYVEDEAKTRVGANATEFDRTMARAAAYADYEFRLTYLAILKAAGISLDGYL